VSVLFRLYSSPRLLHSLKSIEFFWRGQLRQNGLNSILGKRNFIYVVDKRYRYADELSFVEAKLDRLVVKQGM